MTSSIPHKPHVRLQGRDVSVLRALFEARVMTLDHLAILCFDAHGEAAKKRVQKLKLGGYVAERPRRPYERSVLFLTKRGFHTLTDSDPLDGYPHLEWTRMEKRVRVSPQTLAHELAVMDVKAAIIAALADSERFTIEQFTTWPLMCQFRARPGPGSPEMLVKPDGYLRIADRSPGTGPKTQHLFVELDRSTEPQGRLAIRAACYRDYYRRGRFGSRIATTSAAAAAQEHFPFRVLFIFRNAERRNNAAERLLLLRPPILSQAWLTTLDELTAEPLGAIWVRPVDYRDALAETRFPIVKHPSDTYHRSIERERFIQKTAKKQTLLA